MAADVCVCGACMMYLRRCRHAVVKFIKINKLKLGIFDIFFRVGKIGANFRKQKVFVLKIDFLAAKTIALIYCLFI